MVSQIYYYRCSDWLGVCGGTDDIDHKVGMREHRNMAAFHLTDGGTHTLRHGTLQVGVNGLVTFGDDEPARFGLPCRAFHLLGKQVGSRRVVSRPNDILLLLREIPREAFDALLEHPNASVRDFDVPEDACRRKLFELAVDRLVSIRRDRGDIYQAGNTVIRSGGRYDGTTVRVADKDSWAADPSQRAFYCGNVGGVRVEAVLGGHHFVSLRLKCRNHLVEA